MRSGFRTLTHILGMIPLLLVFIPPFAFYFYYTTMRVETSLLKRKISGLTGHKELLIKKNTALRRAISGISPETRRHSLQRTAALENRIVSIELTPELETE